MKYAQFCFLEKGMGLVSPTHFVYDISKKKGFPWYILLIEQILLSDWFYFLRYWAIVCSPRCNVVNFEIILNPHIV